MKTMTMGELPPDPKTLPTDDEDVAALDQSMLDEDEADGQDESMVYNEDGSVDISTLAGKPKDGEFDENLAEVLPDSMLSHLGTEYVDLIEQDIKAREARDQQYAEGIKRTGLGNEAPGGADFDGASKAVHPMLAKGCVDFASRAIKELFPATGPCKTQIIGDQTEAKVDRAERKKQYMNWQATTQIEENRSELERLLSQVPLGGAQYKRWWYDPEQKRSRTQAVFIDDVFTPYGHSDFYTSPRVTFRERIIKSEYDRRVRTGLYRDLDLVSDSFLGMHEDSESRKASDKVEGVDPDAVLYNEDGLRLVYLVEVLMELEDDPLNAGSAPYVMHIDASTSKVLGVFRNWKEGDERKRKKHWMSEWSFIPWRGGPAVGLAHLIGSMSGAATGALRAIIDAAQIQNFPGGLKLAGGKTAGQSIQVNATELAEIAAPAGTTDPDIRKLVMPFPFNGPSQVLFNTLEWLTQQAEQVVATASESISNAGNDMPVGTALALIEHGSANFSAIHARLHYSMKKDLEIQHRLNSEYMDDEETVEDLGELVVGRADFQGPMDIIPVSDPNIFSEAQRYAQLQAVLQLKADPQFQPFFKADQLLARALKLLQVPDVDGLANLPKDAKRLDPLEENYVASSSDESRPLRAYEDQDHLAHLKAHIHFATSPMLGANPLMASGVMPKMLQHCKEHLLALYKQHSRAATEAMQVAAKMQGLKINADELQLQGAAFADQLMAELLGPMVMPGLQQMQQIVTQLAQASAPKPSPEVSLVESTKKELKTMELQAQATENDKNRQQQQSAAEIAARVELQQQQAQADLAQLAAQVQLLRDQQNNGAKQVLAEFEAATATNRLVLQEVLTVALQGMAQEVKTIGDQQQAAVAGMIGVQSKPGNDGLAEDLLTPLLPAVEVAMGQALQGLSPNSLMGVIQTLAQQQQSFSQALAQMRDGNALATQELASSIASVAQLAQQERHSEIYVGPDGKKRARSFLMPPSTTQQ